MFWTLLVKLSVQSTSRRANGHSSRKPRVALTVRSDRANVTALRHDLMRRNDILQYTEFPGDNPLHDCLITISWELNSMTQLFPSLTSVSSLSD
ncbi:hypothetical protein RRG08_009597 [Elysia crispata]|uniref:Uncharacterized protein n=1 Tax=Elysia crispata TaxID=231223 RepID=A0AAE0XTL6_9GAST|nr:hypothetical protein RRG08_009597 [Elysia crispata]